MREWLTEFRLYPRLVGARLRGQMQYRGSFIILASGNFIVSLVELATLLILFGRFVNLGGWDATEVIFLYALSNLAFGLAHLIGSGLSGFNHQMIRGDFDRVLTRPISPFLQVLATDLPLARIGQPLQGAIVMAVTVYQLQIDWTAGRLLYFPIVIVSGVILFLALFALEATFCFWTIEGLEAVNAFTYGGSDLAQYPMHIFDQWLRHLFFWIIPIGFVIFTPSLYLLDKPDPLGLPTAAQYLAPVAALLFAGVAGLLWSIGVRHYRSTGS